MPGFDPVSLALGGLSIIPQLYASYQQNKKADALQIQDTTTNGEREQLAMSRQAAATGRMPGMGAAQNRLAQVQAGAMQNARLGAASSADFLASAGAADARQQQGEEQLITQGQTYQDQSKMQLRRDLTTQSQRQQKDLDTYNQNKAALIQGSATNLNNAVQTGASYAAQSYNMGAPGSRPYMGGNSGVGTQGYNQPGAGYDDPSGGAGGYYPGISNMGAGRYPRRANMGISSGYPQ